MTLLKFNKPENYIGYSNTVEINLGNCTMLIIAGQIPYNNKGEIVEINNMQKQTEQVLQNIKNLIEKSGGNIDDLVKMDIYTTNISKINDIRVARDKFINKENPPTSTIMEVNKLFRDEILIEISGTAIIEK